MKTKRVVGGVILGGLMAVLVLTGKCSKEKPLEETSGGAFAGAPAMEKRHAADERSADTTQPLSATTPSRLSQEVEAALKTGAKAKATLKVVDSTGKPVAGAHVHVHFTFFNRPDNDVEGATDRDGLFTAEKETTLSFQWAIRKNGYYETDGKYHLTQGLSNDSVKNGRWQPWNPTVEVVLKEKRNPTPMTVKIIKLPVPAYEEPVGFDLEEGDWVTPHGKGTHADVSFDLKDEYIDRDNQGQTFRMLFSGATDGVIRLQKEKTSGMPSLYEAPDAGYRKELVSRWQVENGRMVEDSRIKEEDYLVFRYRSRVNDAGNIEEARYGKLYGEFDYSFGMPGNRRILFAYYLNPTPNDRNLEAEGMYP